MLVSDINIEDIHRYTVHTLHWKHQSSWLNCRCMISMCVWISTKNIGMLQRGGEKKLSDHRKNWWTTGNRASCLCFCSASSKSHVMYWRELAPVLFDLWLLCSLVWPQYAMSFEAAKKIGNISVMPNMDPYYEQHTSHQVMQVKVHYQESRLSNLAFECGRHWHILLDGTYNQQKKGCIWQVPVLSWSRCDSDADVVFSPLL